MAKKSSSPASDRELTPAQERAFGLFDGEPLTPNDVANRLDVSVATVRQHLRVLVAAKRIDMTRRGRVVYYHKPGVEVPERENENENENDDDDDDDAFKNPNDELDDAHDNAGDNNGHVVDEDENPIDHPGSAPVDIGGDASEFVNHKQAIPTFDEAALRASAIVRLLEEITDQQIPHVIEAMKRMSALKENNNALEEFYDEYVAEHGLNKHLLIRFFMVTVLHGIDPSTLFERKNTAIKAPAATQAHANTTDDWLPDDEEEEFHPDVPETALIERINALKPILDMREEILALETVHGMQEAELPPEPARKVRTRRQKESLIRAKLVIDPEKTPSRQMLDAVYAHRADDLGQEETNLAASLLDIESRLSEMEWAEYGSLLALTTKGAHTDGTKRRFRELLGKAHRPLPKDVVDELCSILLIPPLLRNEQQLARYDQLLHDFLEP